MINITLRLYLWVLFVLLWHVQTFVVDWLTNTLCCVVLEQSVQLLASQMDSDDLSLLDETAQRSIRQLKVQCIDHVCRTFNRSVTLEPLFSLSLSLSLSLLQDRLTTLCGWSEWPKRLLLWFYETFSFFLIPLVWRGRLDLSSSAFAAFIRLFYCLFFASFVNRLLKSMYLWCLKCCWSPSITQWE